MSEYWSDQDVQGSDDEDYGREGTVDSNASGDYASGSKKTKRFRLTHQQTRFLMAEFVKQPHPDAAQRERLASEIPGLTARQVQVWFQNRRAKIKRLNEEDRDQVLRMRTVPEDFDNVQALHSPYGASRNIAQQHMRYPSEPGAGRASPSMTTPGFQFPPGRGPPMPAGYAPGPESGYGHGYEGQPSAMAPYPDSRHMRHGSLMGGGRLPQPMQPGQPFPESRDDPRAQASRWGGGGGPGEYPGYGHPEGHSLYRTSSQPDIGIGLYNTGGYHDPQSSVIDDRRHHQQQSPDADSSGRFPPMSMHMDMRSRYRTGSHEPSPLGRHARPGPTSSGQYFRSNSYTSTYPPTPLTPPDMYRQEAGDNALPCYPGSQYPGSTGTTSSSQFSGPTYSTAGGMTPQSAGFPPMGGPGFPPGPPGPPGSGPFH